MVIYVGINGFGRIGRQFFRTYSEDPRFKIVGINDLMTPEMAAHLLKYDSTFGIDQRAIRYKEKGVDIDSRGSLFRANYIFVNDDIYPYTRSKEPENIPWATLPQVVLESTGVFRTREDLERHLKTGVEKVLLSAPAKTKGDVDLYVVYGVNDDLILPEHKLISNSSCTSNALAPVASVLDDAFGIVSGYMLTVHGYTKDQNLQDAPHKDLRRARAAAINIIPTTTGAAEAVGYVLPNLQGKLTGLADRVSVADGSIVHLVANFKEPVSIKKINEAIRYASEHELLGVLEYSEAPLVSSDIIGNSHSSIFDSNLTRVLESDERTAFVSAWYDNEGAFARRCGDVIAALYSNVK